MMTALGTWGFKYIQGVNGYIEDYYNLKIIIPIVIVLGLYNHMHRAQNQKSLQVKISQTGHWKSPKGIWTMMVIIIQQSGMIFILRLILIIILRLILIII